MSEKYYAIRGRHTDKTPHVVIASGSKHEDIVLEGGDLPKGEVITCDVSIPLKKGKAKNSPQYLYWDITISGELVVTEKAKAVLENVASSCVNFYPCQLDFMVTAETFYIMKVTVSEPVTDFEKCKLDPDDDEHFMSVALNQNFLKEIPKKKRMVVEMMDVHDIVAFHSDVYKALEKAGVTGICAYPLSSFHSSPFEDEEHLRAGKSYYQAPPK